MSESRPAPVWSRGVAWWHAAIFLSAAFGFYFAPVTFFGDAAYLQMGRFAISLLAAVLFALSMLLVMALLSGSRSRLRLVLLGVLLVDIQIPFLLVSHLASVEVLETRAGVPLPVTLLFSIFGLAVPSAFAIRALRGGDRPAT